MQFLSDKGRRRSWQPATGYRDIVLDSGATRTCLGSGSLLELGIAEPSRAVAVETFHGIEGEKRPIRARHKHASVRFEGIDEQFEIRVWHSKEVAPDLLVVSPKDLIDYFVVVLDRD